MEIKMLIQKFQKTTIIKSHRELAESNETTSNDEIKKTK